jgi:hypothetical protein
MKYQLVSWLCAAFFLVATGGALAKQAPSKADASVKLNGVMLYQPDEDAARRLVDGTAGLAKYLDDLERAFVTSAGSYKGKPVAVGVAVVIQPGRAKRIWKIAGEGEDAEANAIFRKAQSKLLAQRAPEVNGGPFGFALVFTVGGARYERPATPPIPREWAEAIKSRPSRVGFDEMIAAVWPGGAAAEPAQRTKQARAPSPEAPQAKADPFERAKEANRKTLVTQSACEYKPVMSDDDLRRCGITPRTDRYAVVNEGRIR